ncbi:glycerophosphoryl diester phosphodiesterase [Trueperella bonasi]|uniref:Glycerophosphoryl diester phosphodiesterase n=1 Tax=Trueperella bonasi TaxID=312286 RepID=A0ABT9NFU8_9ACTO|nr:glycerophosphoryl diester phosphodiesterase [Trueperella bonasi]
MKQPPLTTIGDPSSNSLAEYIHPEASSLTKERVDAFHDAGYGINVWTVDDPARANQLVNWGVDGVVSKVADQLMGIARASVN